MAWCLFRVKRQGPRCPFGAPGKKSIHLKIMSVILKNVKEIHFYVSSHDSEFFLLISPSFDCAFSNPYQRPHLFGNEKWRHSLWWGLSGFWDLRWSLMGDHTRATPGIPLVWQSMDKIWASDLISSKIAIVSNPGRFGVTLINTGLTNTTFIYLFILNIRGSHLLLKWCLVVIFYSYRSVALWGGQSHLEINDAGSVLLTDMLEKLYIQQMPTHSSFMLDTTDGRLCSTPETCAHILFLPSLRRGQNFAFLYFS